jgi:hypothetical protein
VCYGWLWDRGLAAFGERNRYRLAVEGHVRPAQLSVESLQQRIAIRRQAKRQPFFNQTAVMVAVELQLDLSQHLATSSHTWTAVWLLLVAMWP